MKLAKAHRAFKAGHEGTAGAWPTVPCSNTAALHGMVYVQFDGVPYSVFVPLPKLSAKGPRKRVRCLAYASVRGSSAKTPHVPPVLLHDAQSGPIVKLLRMKCGLRQCDVGRNGPGQNGISRLETGTYQYMWSAGVLEKVAQRLGVPAFTLMLPDLSPAVLDAVIEYSTLLKTWLAERR